MDDQCENAPLCILPRGHHGQCTSTLGKWVPQSTVDDLERRLREVEGQRDKCREALERIASWPIHGGTSSTAQTLIRLARAVLHDTETPT